METYEPGGQDFPDLGNSLVRCHLMWKQPVWPWNGAKASDLPFPVEHLQTTRSAGRIAMRCLPLSDVGGIVSNATTDF